MDFKQVLKELLSAFDKDDIHYALVGGLALGAWGIPRATVDIDFLVRRDDLEKIEWIMQRLSYECRHRSENVSQYVSPAGLFGEVDFLHAFRQTSLEMLQRAEKREVFGGALRINVLQPEDLIGLKLQAIKNDPSRESSDIADIENLLYAHAGSVDWPLVEEYFTLFDMQEIYERIRKGLKK